MNQAHPRNDALAAFRGGGRLLARACAKKLRYSERSEAESYLSAVRSGLSAIEGPGRFFKSMGEPETGGLMHGGHAASWDQRCPSLPRLSSLPARSFDFGSAVRDGNKNLPLAFAQDDGLKKRADFSSPWRIRERENNRVGFTLLEMLVVLCIIVILFGVSMPAVQSAFTEQTVRSDSHELALMVKTAMIQSSEQHRAYEIDLSAKSMALHPVGQAAADPDASSNDDDVSDASSNGPGPVKMPDVSFTQALDPSNKLLMPDPVKANTWVAMADGTQWVFQPGELCPATVVRVGHGPDAWLQLTFDALTGNVAEETYSLP